MIEISPNPASPAAMIVGSTESGRFLPISRDEFVGLIDAVKRGVFDPLLTDPTASAAAWSPEQVAEQQEWDRTHPRPV